MSDGRGDDGRGLVEAAALFRTLGSESRLTLLVLLGRDPRTVGALVEVTGLSQPLVSQHLRTLRLAGLVHAARDGREVTYHVADLHVSHLIADAVAHVQEPTTAEEKPRRRTGGEKTEMSQDVHAEHSTLDHTHGADCGHQTVQHGDHTDYLHGTHHHALHGDHYDEHESIAEHGTADHTHGADCGHQTVEHGDHTDYLHGEHRHAVHADHYDEH